MTKKMPWNMTMNEPGKRRRAWLRGFAAEGLAAWFLRLKGYRIVARRLRTPVGEIDIVARRARLVAFVEVKARADYADAVNSVTKDQQRRIERAAQFFYPASRLWLNSISDSM